MTWAAREVVKFEMVVFEPVSMTEASSDNAASCRRALDTQAPSANQNRPRQTCRIDHGSQQSQTSVTTTYLVFLRIASTPWMTTCWRKRAHGRVEGMELS